MTLIREEDVLGVWRDGDNYTIIIQDEGDQWRLSTTTVPDIPDGLEKFLFIVPSYLDKEVHVIISTLSGDCLAVRYYEQIIAPLLDTIKVKKRPLYTTSKDSVKQFAKELCGTVIMLSGDGGINDLINAVTCRVTIILLPLGSGNAVYHSHINNGLRTLLRGTPRPLPSFRATFENATLEGEPITSILGVAVASYGFHPTLIEESEKCRELGPVRFEMVAEKLLKTPRTYMGYVNGKKMKGYAAATVVKKLDDRFCISPANELRLVHTDTSELLKGYSEGLDAHKVDKVEIDAYGKICVDGILIHVNGLAIIEETESVMDLVV